jgi:hypothetical protein
MRDLILDSTASEIWPGITWTSRVFENVLWVQGRAENGREEQRGIPFRLGLGERALVEGISAVCSEIAAELQPALIDRTTTSQHDALTGV